MYLFCFEIIEQFVQSCVFRGKTKRVYIPRVKLGEVFSPSAVLVINNRVKTSIKTVRAGKARRYFHGIEVESVFSLDESFDLMGKRIIRIKLSTIFLYLFLFRSRFNAIQYSVQQKRRKTIVRTFELIISVYAFGHMLGLFYWIFPHRSTDFPPRQPK